MKITLESTAEIVEIHDPAGGWSSARMWSGETERGTPITAFIARIVAAKNDGTDELSAELAPKADTQAALAEPDFVADLAARIADLMKARLLANGSQTITQSALINALAIVVALMAHAMDSPEVLPFFQDALAAQLAGLAARDAAEAEREPAGEEEA